MSSEFKVNNFDNIIVDINEMHEKFDQDILSSKKHIIDNNYKFNIILFLSCKINFIIDAIFQLSSLNYFLIMNGFKKKWFVEFNVYWSKYLKGRPLKLHEFFYLAYDYRKKNQLNESLNWDEKTAITNWQDPIHISSIFNYLQKEIFKPIHSYKVTKYFNRNLFILEYGCGISPFYSLYYKYFRYLNCRWDLIDIPNHTYHYAKFRFNKCLDIKNFYTINQKSLKNPTKNLINYDLIIIKEVFEHLPNPLEILKQLHSKLKVDGILVFDFIISDFQGLDHPNAYSERKDCLHFIEKNFKFLSKKHSFKDSVNTTFVKKI